MRAVCPYVNNQLLVPFRLFRTAAAGARPRGQCPCEKAPSGRIPIDSEATVLENQHNGQNCRIQSTYELLT